MASNQNLAVTTDVTGSWKVGFKVQITLTNTSDTAVEGWSLALEDTGFEISKVWGAAASASKDGLTIESDPEDGDWAQSIAPGETVTIGFIGRGTPPDAIVVTDIQTPSAEPAPAEMTVRETATDPGPEPAAEPLFEAARAPEPAPEPKAAPDPAPAQTAAVAVGFEDHTAGRAYDDAAQARDFDIAYDVGHRMDGYAHVDDAQAHSGDMSLRIDYAADTRTGMGLAVELPEEDEYYMSYHVMFADEFDFNGAGGRDGGKLPGLAGAGGVRTGGEAATGDNGFSARYMWREDGQAELYLYHMDQPGTYGDSIDFQTEDGEDVFFQTGQWHHLVQRVRINDGDRANGEIDVWLDGRQVLDLDGLRLVTNGQGIDRGALDSFHGGGDARWLPEREQSAYFDDFVFSTRAEDTGLF